MCGVEQNRGTFGYVASQFCLLILRYVCSHVSHFNPAISCYVPLSVVVNFVKHPAQALHISGGEMVECIDEELYVGATRHFADKML